MAIEDLVAVRPPPREPIQADLTETRGFVEENLGLALPNDLFDYCSCYGTGRFGDTIRVYNAFAPSYIEIVNEVCNVYQDLRISEGKHFIPYQVFPSQPGLFPWGDDVNGHMMFWFTEGEADEWPIVLLTVDGECERIHLSMTTFLARVLNREMSCVLWSDSWLQENAGKLDFRPESDS